MKKLCFILIAINLLFLDISAFAGDQELLDAVRRNDLATVRSMLRSGANVNARDENGASLVMWAAYRGGQPLVATLIDHGADPRQKGIIITNKDGTEFYGSVSATAIGENKLELLRYLLDTRLVSVNDRELSRDTMKETGWTLLQRAARHGRMAMIKLLIEQGARLDNDERGEAASSLAIAARYDQEEVVRYLVESGANLEGRTTEGFTALHFSAEHGRTENIRLLLRKGANVDVLSDEGWTPLLVATEREQVAAVQVLRCAGASLDIRNKDGQSPFDLANAKKRDGDDLYGILSNPDCISPALLEAFNDTYTKNSRQIMGLIKELKNLYGSENYPVYTGTLLQDAFRIMADTGEPEMIPQLIDALRIPNLRLEASFALRRYPVHIVMPALVASLRDGNPDIRLRILEIMAVLDSATARRYLERMLNDNDNAVRAYAKMRLRQLGKPKPAKLQTSLIHTPGLKPMLIAQTGHQGEIGQVKFSPDGRYVLTGSNDRTAVIWDAVTGKEVRRFEGCPFAVQDVAFSANGRYVGAACADVGPVIIWEAGSGRKVTEFELSLPRPHIPLPHIAFAPDSLQVLTSDEDFVRLWDFQKRDLEKKKEVFHFQLGSSDFRVKEFGNKYEMKQLCDALRNSRIANESERCYTLEDLNQLLRRADLYSKIIAVSSLQPSEYLTKLKEAYDRTREEGDLKKLNRSALEEFYSQETPKDLPLNSVTAVDFSPDGRYVLAANPNHIFILDRKTGKQVEHLEFWDNRVGRRAVFSPSGLYILTNENNMALLLDVETGNEVRRFLDRGIRDIAFSPDGNYIATANLTLRRTIWERQGRLWDVESGREIKSFKATATAIAFSPNGKNVLAGGLDHNAHLWDIQSGQEMKRFEGKVASVYDIALSKDNDLLLTGSEDGNARLWDLKGGKEVQRFTGHKGSVNSVAFSPNNKYIGTASNDRTARLWDKDSGREIHPFLEHTKQVNSITFSPNGKYVATASEDRSVRVWYTDSGLEKTKKPIMLKPWPWTTVGVKSVSFSKNSDALLTVINQGKASIWNVDSEQLKVELEGDYVHEDSRMLPLELKCAEYMPDENFVVGGAFDGTIHVWDVQTGKRIQYLKGHYNWAVESIAFLPEHSQIVTGSFDSTARLWDLKHPEKEIRKFEGHSSWINSVKVSNDENIMFTAGIDGTTRLWDIRSGRELCKIISFADDNWVTMSPDGRFDTNNLDEIKALHWVFPDDPFRTLPPEIYMRDYYEPKLLPRLLYGKKNEFKAVRPLQSLNRAQPQVKGIRLFPGKKPNTVTAEVDVEGGLYRFEQTGKTEVTGAYDLRLFRDGQLVGQYPEPKASTPDGVSGPELRQWQNDTRVVKAGGKKTVPFADIKLPHRFGMHSAVEFSAYAFNEDRVKSETAKASIKPATGKFPRKAYLVAVGVDDYGGSGWDLEYAAKDARRMAEVLEPRLKQAGYTPERTVLVSDETLEQATKNKIREAIEGLVGESTPDDIVVLFFSGHGYSGEHSAFYLLPSDSRPGRENWSHPSREALGRCISAEELSRWFRRVDAAEMVLIVDACHSAASIESEGFKPGPLGSKGLGQLAYDKRMRVLAASQSDQAAREMGGQIGAGVLTYTLLHDGLEANQAADEKGNITLKSCLEYPVKRVPQLFEEIRDGKVSNFGVPVKRTAVPAADVGGIQREGAVQVPALFDFTRTGGAGVILGRMIQKGNSNRSPVKP